MIEQENKVALITGINGQDGSYLSEFLLDKGYEVHGILKRNSVSENQTARLDKVYTKLKLHYADMSDLSSLIRVIQEIQPDEIYNLAAQSHVAVSFEVPEYTANVDALGALRILEAIKFHGLEKKTKFYQAGTSEMYGKTREKKKNEKTPFYPLSPYGVAKLYAHWITVNYREAYGIFASNGILFNHESPRRGETFVTKKIIKGLCDIKKGKIKKIYLGNLDSKRDWGHAKDYCYAMWKILQHKKPDDFVIATGNQISVKSFVDLVAKKLKINIKWTGKGINLKGIDIETNKAIVQSEKKYFRPLDVVDLLGDSKKAREKLGWKPSYNLSELINEMISYEMKLD